MNESTRRSLLPLPSPSLSSLCGCFPLHSWSQRSRLSYDDDDDDAVEALQSSNLGKLRYISTGENSRTVASERPWVRAGRRGGLQKLYDRRISASVAPALQSESDNHTTFDTYYGILDPPHFHVSVNAQWPF